MRLYPGKENCHIIDMVASLETGIVTTPTLFGLDPSELVNEASVADMTSTRERNEAEKQRELLISQGANSSSIKSRSDPQRVTFTDYDSVFDLLEDTSGERHIRAMSRHAWVEVGPDRYILPTSTSGAFLKIEMTVDNGTSTPVYVVWETVPLVHFASKAPFRTPREISRSETFADAVHAADTFAKEKYPSSFIVKHQSWRRLPATEGQLAFLNRFRSKTDQLTPEKITKGRAGDMITKMKHGARGRFAKVEAGKRREERAKLKNEQELALKERELVRVGPLLD